MSSNLLMESFDELYVLLYSESQKCFRIDSVSHVIDKNIRMYLGEKLMITSLLLSPLPWKNSAKQEIIL